MLTPLAGQMRCFLRRLGTQAHVVANVILQSWYGCHNGPKPAGVGVLGELSACVSGRIPQRAACSWIYPEPDDMAALGIVRAALALRAV